MTESDRSTEPTESCHHKDVFKRGTFLRRYDCVIVARCFGFFLRTHALDSNESSVISCFHIDCAFLRPFISNENE